MPEVPILSVLRERADLTPHGLAFTFTDYDRDWEGVAESLTWSQLYRRTLNAAHEISIHGSPGDRALIVAPQGLAYIVAFLGALQAGFIAVPLAVPVPGAHEERLGAVITDTSPSVVLTTSGVFDIAAQYVDDGAAVIAVIAVDTLDLDAEPAIGPEIPDGPDIAYLQYTSGSTRVPAGVIISHDNLYSNFRQLMADYFGPTNGVVPQGTTIVSWLPFYHDMGLVFAVVTPILGGYPSHLSSPLAFLQRPARWVQAMAAHSHVWSAAPNFAFDLAAGKTSDDDMAGLDLGNVDGLISGAERIDPRTLKRFADRFAAFNFRDDAYRPSYGLAEGTVYAATRTVGGPPKAVSFNVDTLTAGTAVPVLPPAGSALISYGTPRSPLLRVVDPDTLIESPAGTVGEVWMHGDNVSVGYWHKPKETALTFGGVLTAPTAGTPEGPWLRTGDLGFMFDDELFILGRMKDMIIVRGRNHYPDDIEATVQKITRGRVAAIAVSDEQTEKLVTIVELKNGGDIDELTVVKSEVIAAISRAHGLQIADIVLVEPGSIPTTTSGKIRRSACGEQHRQGRFVRLDA